MTFKCVNIRYDYRLLRFKIAADTIAPLTTLRELSATFISLRQGPMTCLRSVSVTSQGCSCDRSFCEL